MSRGGHAYTPLKTREAERVIQLMACKQHGANPLIAGPIQAEIEFVIAPPKRPKNKNFHVTKPDLDNLIKLVLDALNGIVWEDDSQIVHLCAKKRYAVLNERPFIELIVKDLSEST